jgi:hypothetical protein
MFHLDAAYHIVQKCHRYIKSSKEKETKTPDSPDVVKVNNKESSVKIVFIFYLILIF